MTKHIIDALIALNQANKSLIDALSTGPEDENLIEGIEKGQTRIIGALKAMNQQT